MKRLMVCGIGMLCILSAQAGVEIGVKAPDFTAKDQDGAVWTLSEHTGPKPIVLYFYPAAMTGGCTRQACAYRDHIQSDDAFTVVGISADPVENLKAFRQAENLNFTLLSDADGAIAEAYGVPVRPGAKSIKRTVNGEEVELKRDMTTARWTFLVDRDGKIVLIEKQAKPVEDLKKIREYLSDSE